MAVAELPPRISAPIQNVCSYYELEGESSHSLLEEFGVAIRQWLERPSLLVNSVDDAESITHVPFPKAGTMRVRFKMAGAMTPRIIEIDVAVEE